MKITKISLQSFRAFDEPYELSLGEGKNLLLHGENGSGKSSIYLALKRFFEERGDDIAKHRNCFSPEPRSSHVRLHIKGADSTGTEHDRELHWDTSDGHPLPVPRDPATAPITPDLRALLVDASQRSGFLDYRTMLRTSLISYPLSRSNRVPRDRNAVYGDESTGLEAQLFDLVSLVILAGIPVPIIRGQQTTLGKLIRDVWDNRPSSRHKNQLAYANQRANRFNQAFNAILPDLEAKLKDLLAEFEDHQLEINLLPVSLTWEKASLELKGAELKMEIKFRGKDVTNHHQFLNEARLSAIATCLFLAGVQLSDNDYGNAAYPRFLVLDDALIGLELQNRLPVLKILTSEAFKHYQIFLLTHDRVWFELARGHLSNASGWVHHELIGDESTGHLIPKSKPCEDDLDIARRHLTNGDLKAAAVYARSAFEWKLRNVCEKKGIKLPFKANTHHVGAGDLWDGIMARQADRVTHQQGNPSAPDFVSASLASRVQTIRTTVLNRLSHSGAHGLVASEVQDAIDTIQNVIRHTFPNP